LDFLAISISLTSPNKNSKNEKQRFEYPVPRIGYLCANDKLALQPQPDHVIAWLHFLAIISYIRIADRPPVAWNVEGNSDVVFQVGW
jgi:hypothetical protein